MKKKTGQNRVERFLWEFTL